MRSIEQIHHKDGSSGKQGNSQIPHKWLALQVIGIKPKRKTERVFTAAIVHER